MIHGKTQPRAGQGTQGGPWLFLGSVSIAILTSIAKDFPQPEDTVGE